MFGKAKQAEPFIGVLGLLICVLLYKNITATDAAFCSTERVTLFLGSSPDPYIFI